MKKRALGKSIMIIAYSVLLCVSVSFAWILNMEPNVVQNVDIDYSQNGSLIVAPSDIEGKLYAINEYGREVEVDEDFQISSKDVVPNSVVPFTIKIRNNTEKVAKIDISMVGIQASNENILQVVYFSATPSSGWDTMSPPSIYKQLGEAKKGSTSQTYSMELMDEVLLRPTDKRNKKDCLEFSCYLYFDGETMTNEHQKVEFKFGAIRLTQA